MGLSLSSGTGRGDAEVHPCMVSPGSNKTKVSFLGKSGTEPNAPMGTSGRINTQSRVCFYRKISESSQLLRSGITNGDKLNAFQTQCSRSQENVSLFFCTGCPFCILVKVAIVFPNCAAAWHCSHSSQDPHSWDK